MAIQYVGPDQFNKGLLKVYVLIKLDFVNKKITKTLNWGLKKIKIVSYKATVILWLCFAMNFFMRGQLIT